MTTESTRRAALLATLSAFVSQRPGFDTHNYNSAASYRADCRQAQQGGADFRALFAYVEASQISADAILDAATGRLTFEEISPGRFAADYCVGQYFPTEYRYAAASLLARVIWNAWRDLPGCSTPHNINREARRVFGRGIASRYFN